MNSYTIVSDDNVSTQSGYVKIGTFPLQPIEKSGYDFPANNENIVLDAYWLSSYGTQAQYAKFGICLLDSTRIKVYLLSSTQSSRLVQNPIAYTRTVNGFDLYVRANSDVYSYQNVKCVVTSINSRFIPLSGNIIEDISSLSPTIPDISSFLLNIDNSTLTNSSINNFTNGTVYVGQVSSVTITIPNYSATGRYLIRITNVKSGTYLSIDLTVYNETLTAKYPHDDETLTATISEGVITLSHPEWYSYVYYEIIKI